jgi:hypothetical protein
MRSKEYLLTCLLYWLLWLKVVVKVVVLFTVFFLTASEKDIFFPQLLFICRLPFVALLDGVSFTFTPNQAPALPTQFPVLLVLLPDR